MAKVNVLVAGSWTPERLARIASFDERVRLLNEVGQGQGTPKASVDKSFPQELLALLPQTEVLLTERVPPDVLDRARGLKWIQAHAAGFDSVMSRRLMESDVIVTSASGANAVSTSEAAVGGILALARRFPQAVRNQAAHQWARRREGEEVAGKTVGIIGAGEIGMRVAQLCKALEMRVVGIRRSVTEARGPEGPVDLLLPPSELGRLLGESDYIVVAAPRTPETEGMLDDVAFRRVKPGAYLINVARGSLVVEEALIRALREGRLAGAYLDVFEREPLPSESPLWDMPNVLMTPHIAGLEGEPFAERMLELFLTNLRRYLDGQPLLNAYRRERGY